jgi:exportin-T
MSSSYSSVTVQQVEQWVMQSGNPSEPENQWQATNLLQDWVMKVEDPSVAVVLFQLLQETNQELVVFYALTALGRVPLNETQRVQLRTYLLTGFSQRQASSSSTFLRNKAATILTQHILQDILSWKTVGSDLIQLAANYPALFLKTVDTLLEDFQMNEAERDSVRTVKDVLKGQYGDVPPPGTSNGGGQSQPNIAGITLLEQLFDCVVRILGAVLQNSNSNGSNGGNGSNGPSPPSDDLTVLALQTVKAFFVWTELSFLGADNARRVLELLLVSMQPHRDAAVSYVTFQAWQEWITSASTIEHNQTSIQSDQDPKISVMMAVLERLHEYNLLPYKGESEADIEVVIEIAKLINAMGLEVLPLWEQEQQDPQYRPNGTVQTLLNQILDMFFRAFSYDDIDVSTAVLPLATRLTVSMEQQQPEQQQHSESESSNGHQGMRQHLPQLLNTLYSQLQYPEDFEYDYEDEDDAEEGVYRTELCKLYTKIVRVAPGVCLQFICEATAQLMTQSIAAAPTPSLEATLRLLYHYCEGVRPAPGMKVVMRNETFCSLLVALHNSDVTNHPHREVLCLYYDTAVRYFPIFQQKEHTHLLSRVLQSITGVRGLQHDHPRVRSRSCYLLLRLVKSVASLLRPFVETAVSGIQGLLSNPNLELRPDDTLYLFETMGLLLGKTGLEAGDQQRYLTQLMTPHVRSIETTLATPGLARDADHYGELLSGSIAAMAHLSKGFSKSEEGVQVILVEMVNISSRVLEVLPMSDHVRNKSMVLLPRMIQCVGERVLPKIPQFLYLLIEHATADDISFVSQLFNQICIKFKEDAVSVIDGSLLPFLRKCHSLIPAQEEVADKDIPPHLRTEQLSIQKLVFVVLQHVVTHGATAVLTSPANSGSLETVLQTMSDGAIYAADPVVKKSCLRFFRELIDQWAGATTGQDVYRRGLLTFVCQTFVPGMLQSMLSPSFDEMDAMQSRNVSDFAAVLVSIKTKNGTEEMYQTMLTNLNANGRFPANVLEALRGANSVETVEACLKELFRIIKRGGSTSS